MFDQIRGMLALPEDPNQNAAARQGLLAAGAALLGGRGDLGGILGDGLMAGSQGYHAGLAQQQQTALRQAQMQQVGLENQKMQAAISKPGRIASILGGTRPAELQQSGDAASEPQAVPPLSALPRLSQASAGAPTAPRLQPVASPEYLYNLYRQRGDALAEAGYMDEAKDQYAFADKQKAKLIKRETLIRNGRPVSVLTYEDGREVDSAYDALPDNQVVDLGGSQTIIDRNLPQVGSRYQKTASPDTVARIAQEERSSARSDATARRGQDLGDARARQELALKRSVIKAPTEFQGKSAAFGLRATEADKTLTELSGKYSPAAINSKNAVGKTWVVGGALEAATNLALTDNDQRAEQAQRDFINSILRQESGAAIADTEFDNARRQYFPQPGDSEAVIKQKARNRSLAIQGLQTNAGPAAMKAPAPASNSGITFLGFE